MNKNNPKIDYGKALNKLRNPALIHKIQDKLNSLEGKDPLEVAIRNMAVSNPNKAIMFCYDSHKENPLMIDEMLGKETITDIYEYLGIEDETKPYEFKKDDLNKNGLTEDELKQLDEEDSSDPDRRYHR